MTNPYTVDECKRIMAECDAAEKPYPWGNPNHALIVDGDARVDYKSDTPLKRYHCSKCDYALTTNMPQDEYKCPNDGEQLGKGVRI